MPDISAALTRAISEAATSFGANEAFGLSRAVARPYYKFSLILEADATGLWVPQQSATVPVIVFEHGVNDNFSGITNPFINAGISGTPATRSIEITNSMRRPVRIMTTSPRRTPCSSIAPESPKLRAKRWLKWCVSRRPTGSVQARAIGTPFPPAGHWLTAQV